MQAFSLSVHCVINYTELAMLPELVQKTVAENELFLTTFREAQRRVYQKPADGRPMPRPRLDQALVQRGLCPSREKAKRAILAGQVRVDGQIARKPGDLVAPEDALTLAAPERYVSRGGYKLEHGLRHFRSGGHGLTAIDLGASTGGFTDCLLQHGAARVYAVDVGRGQLAWKLRRDPRVVVMEKTNARFLTRGISRRPLPAPV